MDGWNWVEQEEEGKRYALILNDSNNSEKYQEERLLCPLKSSCPESTTMNFGWDTLQMSCYVQI